MPTTLGRKYSIDWRGDPPHMLREDIPVWYRFLEKWGDRFNALFYDVYLGGPWLSEAQLQDKYLRMWRANVSKRADVIAELEDEIWIIEVASQPGLRTLGQIQAYRALWLEDPKIAKLERLVIVCETVDTDVIAPAAMYGIQTYVMPASPE